MQDVRYLLLACGFKFDTGDTVPGNPEQALRGDDRGRLSEIFGSWHADQLRTAERERRKLTLQRAAEYVLGDRAFLWLDPGRGPFDDRPTYRGLGSEEGLAKCLAELEAILHEKRQLAGP